MVVRKPKKTVKRAKKAATGVSKKTAGRPLRSRAKARPPVQKRTASRKKAPARKKSAEPIAGKITHYFPRVQAAVIKVNLPIVIGDRIKIKGHTTDFTQTVSSMEVDHAQVKKAVKGDEVGLLVESRVRRHDVVYKV